MTNLLEFIGGWLDGLTMVALAVSVGGMAFVLCVLRILDGHPISFRAAKRSLQVMAAGAWFLVVLCVGELGLKPLALAQSFGDLAWTAYIQTQVFLVGAVSVLIAGALSIITMAIRRDLQSRSRWGILVLLMMLFFVNEAGRTHAAGRIGETGLLMVLTVAHIIGAMTWAGGVMHALLFWWLQRQDADFAKKWPVVISRFSPVGIVSTVLIVLPGSYLAWSYVGDWAGLVGTGYGNMLVVKITFFIAVLSLATFNFLVGREWTRSGKVHHLFYRVPPFVEVEVVLAMGLLFSATALTSFPPAVDVQQQTVTPQELQMMFYPKIPRLAGPELIMIDAPERTDLHSGIMGRKEDLSWDRFNHNISGLLVLLIAAIALLDQMARWHWTRHWPLMFVGFSILIIVFANPDHWPLGPAALTDSLKNTEVVQHWLAGMVVMGLGVFEWRARRERVEHLAGKFIFPVLCLVGGLILLTHSHQIDELKREFLVQSTHVVMGMLGILISCARWLELRLPPPHDRVAGLCSIIGIMLVGFILLFYINPDVTKL